MRPVTRQSLRLVRSTSRKRPSSCVCPLSAQPVRNFHSVTPRLAEPHGFPGHHDRDNEVARRSEEQTKREEGTVTAESTIGGADSQPSADVRKASRTTFRQRRNALNAPDLLKPPPIPEWFLKYNVKLEADPFKPNRNADNAQVVRCIDERTGHTLFVLPYYEAFACTDNGGSNEHQRHQPIANLDKNATPGDSSAMDHQLALDNRGQEPTTARENERTDGPEPNPHGLRAPPSYAMYNDADCHTIFRWVLLEIEASARAAFTLPSQAQNSTLRAASKVDISLICPDAESRIQMDGVVEDLATLLGADLLRLDANDFADLTAEYVGNGSDAPGSFSSLGYDVFDGYTATRSGFARPAEEEDDEELEEDEDEEDEDEASEHVPEINLGNPRNLDELRQALHDKRHELAQALSNVPLKGIVVGLKPGPPSAKSQASAQSKLQSKSATDEQYWYQARLDAVLDALLNAPSIKRAKGLLSERAGFEPRMLPLERKATQDCEKAASSEGQPLSEKGGRGEWKGLRAHSGHWLPSVAGLLTSHLSRFQLNFPYEVETYSDAGFRLEAGEDYQAVNASPNSPRRTIVHVRDLNDMCRTKLGELSIRRLIRRVQRRRKLGEEILFIGTSAEDMTSSADSQSIANDLPLRSLLLPPFFNMPVEKPDRLSFLSVPPLLSRTGYDRIVEINLRHIQSMVNNVRVDNGLDLFSTSSQLQLTLPGLGSLRQMVFSQERVQRVVMTAVGLAQFHAKSDTVTALHIALAVLIIGRANHAASAWFNYKQHLLAKQKRGAIDDSRAKHVSSNSKTKDRIDRLGKACNSHENRLLPGVVDPESIKTGFKEVHAPEETVEALRNMTTLSLLRPDAFKYGVLAMDRLPGLMLYGPPGTGKTLLAKAVAKEARATMLEVSGAQIYEKYVGEGEKMVRAVFSLAKKLSPCIVFIDEADAIFGARSSGGNNRNTHREIINQFLREWDGMDAAHNVFVMVASNRPFDLDDAVLRRLPRRLLVDLPVARDREAILAIHLRDERLDPAVSLSALAAQTPLYSGSDLKNLCVAAALACVHEENKLASSSGGGGGGDGGSEQNGGQSFKLPDKRTLSTRHFDQAMREISASISEDMSSLAAIRKFDEQYGDRRGRVKKAEYGFGTGLAESVNEDAARVRQTPPPAP